MFVLIDRCGPTIDLINSVVNENGGISMKEISLVTKEGRQAAFGVGVKTIPSVLFVKSGILLVTSVEITRDR